MKKSVYLQVRIYDRNKLTSMFYLASKLENTRLLLWNAIYRFS